MKLEDVLTLIKSGYTKTEIDAFENTAAEPAAAPAAEPAATPAAAPAAEPAATPAAAPAAEPAATPAAAPAAEPAAEPSGLSAQLKAFETALQNMNAAIQRNNVVSIGTEPTPTASAEEILTAQIIAPRT